MKKIMLKVRDLIFIYLKWGWPILLANVALDTWAGNSTAQWRSFLNAAAGAWWLCAPVVPVSLLLDRQHRERAMARLCGLREGDERERAITGEASRAALLFGLSLQTILLVLSLVSVRLSWDPAVPKGQKHGLLSVGVGFSSARHLDPFGTAQKEESALSLGAVEPAPQEIAIGGGFLLAPSTFPVLVLLILIQVAVFKAFAMRRYEGSEGA